MGDAAGHVAPGRIALGRDQTCDVVEGQHHLAADTALDAHAQTPRLALEADVDLFLDMGFGARGQFAELGRNLPQRPTDNGRIADGQKLDGAVVDGRDATPAVEADDARRHAGQDGLDEPAAARGFLAGGPERGLLGLEVTGHAVEGGRQGLDLAGAILPVDARCQVARGDAVRRLDETADGRRDRAGGTHAQPDGPDEDQKRGLEIAEGKGGLNARTALLGFPEGDNRLLAIAHLGDQTRLHRPDQIQVGVAIARQRIEGANGVRVFGHFDRRGLPSRGRFEILTRGCEIGRRVRQFAARQHLPVSIDDIERRIAEQVRDLGEEFRELDRIVKARARFRSRQFVRDGLKVRLNLKADVPHIGLPDVGAVRDGRLDVVAEPLVHAPIDQHAEDKRDQDRGDKGHHGEERHETQVETRPRIGPAAEQHQGPAADNGGQPADQQQIDPENRENGLARCGPGTLPAGPRRDRHQPDGRGSHQKGDGVGDEE